MSGEQLPLRLSEDAAEEFTAALGQVLAGGLRLVEWGQDNGVAEALNLSKAEWAQKKLKGHLNWDVGERRVLVAHLYEKLHSTRKVAAALGVSNFTVSEDLKAVRKLTAEPEDAPSERAADVRNLTLPVTPAPTAEPVPCARCGAPTQRLWLNEGEEFAGEVLCAACAAAVADVTADDLDDLRHLRDFRERVANRPRFEPVEPPAGTYAVLYVDPPWQYDFAQSESRAVENQYPTMSLEELLEQAVPAAPDCVLFLWGTSPKLADALQLIAAWGFTYRTCLVWVKDRIGPGYYARQRHELLLVATRGEPGTPAEADRPDSVVSAPRSARHSEKPEIVYDLIERMYPGRPKCELFARTTRAGWAFWGHAVGVGEPA